MSEVEFAFFVILLAVAGNETTRNAMTHGMNAFFDNPEQWELFKRERPDTAVDEIVRWATPVHCFQRTALVDIELGGVTIRQGQRVGLFYSSANYDEDVFDAPFQFDILRDPNPHLSFGGHGAHFCIGANLARMEIKLIFDEIADQIPDIHETRRARAAALGVDQRRQGSAGLVSLRPIRSPVMGYPYPGYPGYPGDPGYPPPPAKPPRSAADVTISIIVLVFTALLGVGAVFMGIFSLAFLDYCPPATCSVEGAVTAVMGALAVAALVGLAGMIVTIVHLVRHKTAWPFAVGTLGLCLVVLFFGGMAYSAAVGG